MSKYKSSPSGAGGLRIGIIGGAGYTGGELIRLLLNHPNAEISFVHSKSNAGNFLFKVHPDLIGETGIQFSKDISSPLGDGGIDVLFLCTGHGEARKFLETNEIAAQIKVIDLSSDFRLSANAFYHGPAKTNGADIVTRYFVYGLPELNKTQIQSAQNIANPGCFATAIQLGLLPLAKAGLLGEIYTTGITGSTGAGQSLLTTSHFSWRANNIQAYKTLTHQHLGEIVQSLAQLQPSFSSPEGGGREGAINFVPWRGDFTRGIFASSTLHCELPLEQIKNLYKDFYSGHHFTIISDDAIFLKQVVNTNKCVIQLEKAGTKLVVHSAIDNLLKGASGQAVQNMNLMFGIDETAGLHLKANYF
ncbi:MAG TPA: N-acetyl-gamma-glutamyl-phosphate reductase [Panacibacter sp.]|nr:N-acetyl-gamma-glutamyl-phosphate reductase [Panacibacter sp.]